MKINRPEYECEIDITIQEYLENRLRNQKEWHSAKSKKYKKKYFILKLIEIIMAGLLPFISILPETYVYKTYCLTLISSLLVVVTSISAYSKYYELWIEYRKISEALKREEQFFITKTNIYKEQDKKEAFSILVEKVENILAVQNNNWEKIIKESNKKNKK